MNPNVQRYLEKQLSVKIRGVQPVNGTNISSAFRLDTSKSSFFIKMNSSIYAYEMFTTEEFGLNLIKESKTFNTPKVYGVFKTSECALIVMSYIEQQSPRSESMYQLGIQLRKLHETLSDSFGLETDNYIGSLIQKNKKTGSWEAFYAKRRLVPQMKLAVKNELLMPEEMPDEKIIEDTVLKLCGNIKPGLVHGDLWSGNFLIGEKGIPYLIDPAVYYGHGEVDIAMSRLFGGFLPTFYEGYFRDDLEYKKYERREELYQLYFLLVHLNLFGRGYYNSVKRIMSRLF